MNITATYSPEDNKIRLRARERLPKELYDRVRAAGFIWAPRQELFVAPAWTPEREDLAEELAGQIDDEDTSLVERAEERAERFEEYGEKRAADAERAHAAVSAIADNIPLGQPILVGHHSERRARKDAERIRNGMTKAVHLWETSKYWEQRAKGALAAAKYKELPGVRHRRIKGLEADERKHLKERERAMGFLKAWHHERWLAHVRNRLAYERAMLDEQGGLAADRFDLQPGGRVLWRDKWYPIVRVNRANGRINSVSAGSYRAIRIEEIRDYQPPSEGDVEKVKKATKLPPITNYRPATGRVLEMPKAEFDRLRKFQAAYYYRVAESEKHGAHRVPLRYLGGEPCHIFITDAKLVEPPPPTKKPADVVALAPETDVPTMLATLEARAERRANAPEPTKFDALKESLRKGVAVVPVSTPHLYPTPPELVDRMMAAADVREEHRALEPSAGTGNLLRPLLAAADEVVAVEIAPHLAAPLKELAKASDCPRERVFCGDFLDFTAEQLGGMFDRVVMNPPFNDGADMTHIQHALSMLRPGGRLVALCANGPRQQDFATKLGDTRSGLLVSITPMPDDSFKAQGTSVRVAMLVVDRLADAKEIAAQ